MSFTLGGGYVGQKRALEEYPYLNAADFKGVSSQYRCIIMMMLRPAHTHPCFPRRRLA